MGIGNNFLNIIKGEAGPIYLGVLIVLVVMAFVQKKTSKLVAVLLTAVVVGGIIFAPELFESFTKGIFSRLLGG